MAIPGAPGETSSSSVHGTPYMNTSPAVPGAPGAETYPPPDGNRAPVSLPQALRELEREMILNSLNRHKWNLSEAAKDLGIIRQSLQYRLKKLHITKDNS